MAIYHFSAKIISRGKGQSAIAAAAYRSGEKLKDEQTDEVKHYRARSERIVFTDIMAPSGAPTWAYDRNRLWNEAERAERRKDAQLAREIEISLPHELTEQQREWLVTDFAREAFVRRGFAVDLAIHAPDRESDERNHHVHMMVTRRALGPEGFAKTKDWQFDKTQLAGWREQWAHLANRHLERHGHDERIDHRSLKDQGFEREPGVHLGYAANEMAQRGAPSDRMDELRAVLDRNDIRVEIGGIDKEIAELERQAAAERTGERQQGRSPAHAAEGRAGGTQDHPPGVRPDWRPGEAWTWQGAGGVTTAQHDHQPSPATPGKPEKAAGLQVLDGVTGVVSKLADFVSDFLASATTSPGSDKAGADKSNDMKAYVTDPAARKQQQLDRFASRQAAENDRKALERIREDMDAGKALSASDVRHLTREHQEQIRAKGDDAMKQMVDDARKYGDRYWKGEPRERERD